MIHWWDTMATASDGSGAATQAATFVLCASMWPTDAIPFKQNRFVGPKNCDDVKL